MKTKDTKTLTPKIVNFSDRPYRLVSPEVAASLTGYSKTYLRNLRLDPDSGLIQGIHWERLNSRVVKYRSPLLEHWAENRNKPLKLSQAIEEYLSWEKAA
jgi:hypothetical protein